MSKPVSGLLMIGLLVLIQGGMAFAANLDADPNLIGYWPLDEGTGTTAFDASGKGNNGTLVNGPTWAAGIWNGAVQLDGTNDGIDCGNAAIFNLTSQVTLAAWVYPSRAANSSHECYITKGDTSYTLKEGSTNGNVELNIYNAGWHTATLTGRTGANNNTWYHVAGTFDGTTLKIFLNGALAGSTAWSGAIATNTDRVNIGRDNNGGTPRRWYQGRIDDVRIYNRALTETEVAALLINARATNPTPGSGTTDLNRDGEVLRWTPGAGAVKHNVYWGTDPNALVLVSAGQEPNTLSLGRLDCGTKYYWRVDEVAANASVVPGYLWQFDVEPATYPIVYRAATTTVPANIVVTASAFSGADPNRTVTGAGLTGDLHGTDVSTIWVTGKTTQPVWIQYNFDRIYKMSQMLVWNYNSGLESLVGFGVMDATVQYSTDGTTFANLGDFVFAQGDSEEGYKYNTVIDFGGVPVKAVKILANSNYGGSQYGLSEVRFLYIRAQATVPSPATAATGIRPDAILSWRSGVNAAQHNVYLGTDANALTLDGTADTPSYTPTTLQLGATYYWRVDEVNAVDGGYPWASDVWRFTIPTYLVVDDMESYNDTTQAVFNTWLDGFTSSANGSQVGNSAPPYAERTLVHGGAQTMPLFYTNTASEPVSEATRTFTPAQDWTIGGITTLVLFVRPDAANTGGQLYVKINNVKVDCPSTLATSPAPLWIQWNIDLTKVAGLKTVNTLTIGVSGLGTGKVFVDDIRLYKTPADSTPKDPGTANLVSYFNMEGGKVVDSIAGITGTLNGTTFEASLGSYGNALKFAGGATTDTTQYVDLGTDYWTKVVSKLSSCSMGGWVYYTGAGAVWQRVFDFGCGANVNTFLTTSNGTAGYARFAVKTGVANAGSTGTGFVETNVSIPRPMTVGWHHLVGVVDATGGALGNPVMYIYLDGAVAGGPVAARLPMDMALQTPTPGVWQMYLGKSQYPDPYFNGSVDELRVYNRALTAGEVYWLAGGR